MDPSRPRIQVLATTAEGTEAALLAASRLPLGDDRRITLLVPRVDSADRRFDPASNEAATSVRTFRELALKAGLDARVMFCVCDRVDDVQQLLARASPVILGGRRHAWWPSAEQRIASRLIGQGYSVVFAPC